MILDYHESISFESFFECFQVISLVDGLLFKVKSEKRKEPVNEREDAWVKIVDLAEVVGRANWGCLDSSWEG